MEATVVPYREELKTAFERLNRQWIETYFAMEDADRKVLGDPKGEIVDRGGEIFFLLEGDQVLGTCAVLRHDGGEFEIAKMAVAPEARGRGYGDRLMDAAIKFAADAGAHRIIIVSNTLLQPAIRLYKKHGCAGAARGGPALPASQHPAGADSRLTGFIYLFFAH